MQPKRHSKQCTKQGMDVQARRVDLDDRQRTKGGPGLSTNLVRLKTQLNKVRRATQLVSVVIQDARNVVDVDPAVFPKTQEAAQGGKGPLQLSRPSAGSLYLGRLLLVV